MVVEQADAVVVGGGIIGTSVALELARRGRAVVVVDRAGGIGHGSTGASSGIVRFHYSTHAGVAVAWEALHVWRDWRGHLGLSDADHLASFQRTGMLVLEPTPGVSARTTELFDEVGVPWERWDRHQLARRMPHVDPGRFGPPTPVQSDAFFAEPQGWVTATYTPDAGHVADPQLAAQNLADAAKALGVRLRLRQEVVGVRQGGPRRWELTTAAHDKFSTDVVVNAAGPWSSNLNALAGVGGDFTVHSRPLRQEVHEVDAPPGFERPAGQPGISLADPDLGFYVRSAGPGRVLVGGMEPECDPLEWLDDPDLADPRPTPSVFEAQVMRAARRFPGLSVPHRPTGIAGVYDATTDWTPIYDRTHLPGYYIAMGTSGNQFKNGPVVGALMTALIESVEAGRDHDAKPVRVRLPRTGVEIDMSSYSRLRPIATHAPGTVMG